MSDPFSTSPRLDRRRFLAGLAASFLLAGCVRRAPASADPRVAYYTCAMHPSVRSDDPKGKCPICGMDLIPVLREAEGGDALTRPFTLSPDQIGLLGVASVPLALREASRSLRVPGRAAAGNAVTASFFEGDARLLARGQAATVTFDALPDLSFPGRIAVLAAAAPASHRREARIALDRPDPRLHPGLDAVVRISVPLGRRLIAPLAAVLPSGERYLVLADLGEGRIEPRYVEVGEILPDGWEIVSGAREGERLVTTANYLIEAQARIEGALRNGGEAR